MIMPNRNNGIHSTPINGNGVAQFKEEIRRLRQEAVDFSQKLDILLDKTALADGTNSNGDGSSSKNGVLFKSHLADDALPRNRRRARGQNGELPEKEFVIQNSVLTDLFHSKHVRTLANVATSMLVLWAILSFVADFLEKQSFQEALPSLALIERAFANYHLAIFCWLKLMAASFAFFPLTRFWALNRPAGPTVTNFDRFSAVLYCLYQVCFLLMPYQILVGGELVVGTGASIAITLEQMRLMMKMHSFLREITKKIFRPPTSIKSTTSEPSIISGLISPSNSPTSSSQSNDEFPGFNRYLYFSFAPTLIYRDEYPLTQQPTDWSFVLANFGQVFGCCVLIYYVFERHVLPQFYNYDARTLTPAKIVQTATANLLPALVVIMTCFFGFLHSWLNAWAELLRFGDRLFYKDWWNSQSYGEYYRSWNSVVHDWLYTYVYKDTQDLLKNMKSKVLSTFLVFTVSAVFHEYVVFSMLKFFFPIFYMNFGVLGLVLFILVRTKGPLFNMFQWASIILGDSLMITMYLFEMSARQQCPAPVSPFGDLLVPRFWSCMAVQLQQN